MRRRKKKRMIGKKKRMLRNVLVIKEKKQDVGECSCAIEHRSTKGVGDDPILESKHKIFLSHSGVQKEIVEHICKALEDRSRYPFFDRRQEGLPKGKEFPKLIIKAVQQCELLVVVVSEEYFMSKWPMIELNAFVQAAKVLKSNVDVAILPLFYGLCVSDLKDEERRQRWLEKWKTFAKDDSVEGRIKVEDWCFALDQLTNFYGLSYDQDLKDIVAYENEIVSCICSLVLPDIKWHDSHVQGNAHEVLFDDMKPIGLSPMYKVKVVGIYGVGGIGKTTTCQMLCNKLSSKYEGRVCHVEFDNTCSNSKELFQNAVIKLIRQNADFVHQLSEGECVDVLHKNLSKHRTFLVIDNVWDNYNSIKQAQTFLAIPFHGDSLVLVTARSESTLARLGIDACLEMPELEEANARRLFLYYASPREKFTTTKDMQYIKWCIEKCYFCKGDGRGYHYHPLALEALGRQLCGFKEKPSQWVERLSGVWKVSYFSRENVVFDVLRSSFDLLAPSEQTFFMDVGLFLPSRVNVGNLSWERGLSWKEHLCVVSKKDELEIQRQLECLKRKGLLQDVNLTAGSITMHDLYRDLVRLVAVGKLGAETYIWDRQWVLVDGDGDGDDGDVSKLEVTPVGGWWHKLSRLSIQQMGCGRLTNLITSLEGIEWKYFSNVLVLHLSGLQAVHGSLDLKGMKCLRSLQIFDLRHLESFEGLESLKHLTYFEWIRSYFSNSIDVKTTTHVVGQFPISLKYLFIHGECLLFESNVLARCNKLIKLTLTDVEVGVPLDLSNCLSLEGVKVDNIKRLQTFSRLTSTLHSPDISYIDGISISGLDQLHGLVRLKVTECGFKREVPCLLSLSKLQALTISTHEKPAEHCIPHQLQELYYCQWKLHEPPCLSAFKHLQVLDFNHSDSLTRMSGMGDLPALQSLNLCGCCVLERLPDLSKSRSLKELNLNDCDKLKLHKEDLAMLATLPLLHPVLFSRTYEQNTIRMDIVRGKVLQYQGPAYLCPKSWEAWKEGKWKELELGAPPIRIGNRGIWDTPYCMDFDPIQFIPIASHHDEFRDSRRIYLGGNRGFSSRWGFRRSLAWL